MKNAKKKKQRIAGYKDATDKEFWKIVKDINRRYGKALAALANE